MSMSGEICTDNRFEIIAAYKKKLVEGTNIQARPEEMEVIDNILFRFWQMGWLPPIPHGRLIDAEALEKDVDKYIGGEESRSRFHHWVQVQRTVIPESEEART